MSVFASMTKPTLSSINKIIAYSFRFKFSSIIISITSIKLMVDFLSAACFTF